MSADFFHGAELANEYFVLRKFMKHEPNTNTRRVMPDQLDNFLRELTRLERTTETPENL